MRVYKKYLVSLVAFAMVVAQSPVFDAKSQANLNTTSIKRVFTESKDLGAEECLATKPAPRPSAFQQWSTTKNPAAMKVEPEAPVPQISELPQPVPVEATPLAFIIPTLYKPTTTQFILEILVAGVAKSNGPKRFFIDNETKPVWYLAIMFNKFISNLGPLFTGYADAGLVLNDYGTATIGVKAPEPKLDPKLNRPFDSWRTM